MLVSGMVPRYIRLGFYVYGDVTLPTSCVVAGRCGFANFGWQKNSCFLTSDDVNSCAMVKSRVFVGDGHPTFIRNPYFMGPINP